MCLGQLLQGDEWGDIVAAYSYSTTEVQLQAVCVQVEALEGGGYGNWHAFAGLSNIVATWDARE